MTDRQARIEARIPPCRLLHIPLVGFFSVGPPLRTCGTVGEHAAEDQFDVPEGQFDSGSGLPFQIVPKAVVLSHSSPPLAKIGSHPIIVRNCHPDLSAKGGARQANPGTSTVSGQASCRARAGMAQVTIPEFPTLRRATWETPSLPPHASLGRGWVGVPYLDKNRPNAFSHKASCPKVE